LVGWIKKTKRKQAFGIFENFIKFTKLTLTTLSGCHSMSFNISLNMRHFDLFWTDIWSICRGIVWEWTCRGQLKYLLWQIFEKNSRKCQWSQTLSQRTPCWISSQLQVPYYPNLPKKNLKYSHPWSFDCSAFFVWSCWDFESRLICRMRRGCLGYTFSLAKINLCDVPILFQSKNLFEMGEKIAFCRGTNWSL
jgi:hypothetical protein